MNIKKIYLPEFVFLDGSEHEPGGNPTAGRTLILHVRTATVLELFDQNNDEFALNPETTTFNFEHTNILKVKENFVFAVHYTFAPDDLPEIFARAAEWYRKYCEWEDRNIANEYLEDNN